MSVLLSPLVERVDVSRMRDLLCTFFQGTYATVGDGFAPLGRPLRPCENRMGRGQHATNDKGQTLRLLDQIGPVGQFGKSCMGREPDTQLDHRIRTDITITRLNRPSAVCRFGEHCNAKYVILFLSF